MIEGKHQNAHERENVCVGEVAAAAASSSEQQCFYSSLSSQLAERSAAASLAHPGADSWPEEVFVSIFAPTRVCDVLQSEK